MKGLNYNYIAQQLTALESISMLKCMAMTIRDKHTDLNTPHMNNLKD